MKRFVLALALTGLLSVPVLAGNIPTNGAVATPTPTPAESATTSSTSASTNTVLANVVITIINLIGY